MSAIIHQFHIGCRRAIHPVLRDAADGVRICQIECVRVTVRCDGSDHRLTTQVNYCRIGWNSERGFCQLPRFRSIGSKDRDSRFGRIILEYIIRGGNSPVITMMVICPHTIYLANSHIHLICDVYRRWGRNYHFFRLRICRSSSTTFKLINRQVNPTFISSRGARICQGNTVHQLFT